MKDTVVSTGKSVFVNWEQMDGLFNQWGKAYFGEHVTCTADREETDCNVAITDMDKGDFAKFKQLYALYDKEKELEPESDFGDGDSYVTLPALISLGVIGEVLDGTGLSRVGGCLAFYDGVLLVEHDISYGEKIPLKVGSVQQEEKPGLDGVIKSCEEIGKNSLKTEGHLDMNKGER